MCAPTTLEDFIARSSAHKVLIVVLHTTQVTETTCLPEAKPKTIFDISCDHLAPNMAIILSIHALHLQRLVSNRKHGWQFEKEISIESNQQ
jgi:hypothetical protein